MDSDKNLIIKNTSEKTNKTNTNNNNINEETNNKNKESKEIIYNIGGRKMSWEDLTQLCVR